MLPRAIPAVAALLAVTVPVPAQDRAAPPPGADQSPAPVTAAAAQEFARRYCAACHDDVDPEADLDVVGLFAEPTAEGDLGIGMLLDVRDVLRGGDMPPSEEPQPSAQDRAGVVAWVGAVLDAASRAEPPRAGRVTMRRLSRFEYANTVRDLLAVDVDVDAFPSDDLGYGFDNIGDALSVSTLHLDKYAKATRRIAAAAFPDPDPAEPPTQRVSGLALRASDPSRVRDEHVALVSRGWAGAEFELLRPGRYRVEVLAWGRQAGDEPARMRVDAADERQRFDVPQERDEPGTFAVEVDATRRRLQVRAHFLNDFYRPDHPDPAERDRNLYVGAIRTTGPLDERAPTRAEQRWLDADPGDAAQPVTRARRILEPLLDAAWRRPVGRREVTRFARLAQRTVDAGHGFHEGLRRAVEAALLAPHFLFRVETGALSAAGSDEDELLDDHALATRLSYFLWSTLPDERLRALADAGELSATGQLAASARRMLGDPRAAALATHFAAQWLELRRLDEVEPDPDHFPDWNAALARSMRRETELLVEHVLREELPVRTLLDAGFSFVDARLARHYELDVDPPEGEFVRVDLPAGRRRGVLGHASVLTVTSNPTRTSPVQRGKWVLANLLDDAPPPPPPGSAAFAGGEESVATAASLREELARHRRDPECAVCHERMDAVGLALEHFDAVGRWRAADAGEPIDAHSALPDGRELDGAAALSRMVAADPALIRALLGKLFVYAVGRPVGPGDVLVLEDVHAALPDEPTLTDLILAIVRLDAFRKRTVATTR